MRILTVVYDLKKGGTQRAAQNFAEAYLADGHDSRVWATDAGGVREAELRARGVPVWIGRGDDSFDAIRDWRPDAIHLHSLGLKIEDVERLTSAFPAARVVETNVFSWPSPWVGAVDVSFQLSRWCEWLYRIRGGPVGRMAVVPNPIRTSGFRRAPDDAVRSFRHDHGIGETELLLGRIGQFYDRKWSPLLVDAFEHVRKAGLAAKLVVVNAPQTILARCEASPYWNDVVVIEEIIGDDAMSLAYSAIDVFVHVADQGESFGIVLTESMLCETPCVVMSTPWEDNSQPDVVGNLVGGLVATSRRGFYDALIRLCRDQPLRHRLGRLGRQRVLERFDSQSVARDALDYIRQQRTEGTPASTGDVLAIYRDAVDTPSWLTLACVGRLRRLQLTRYTTGYEPWSRFFAKCVQVAGRRLGLWAAPAGDSTP